MLKLTIRQKCPFSPLIFNFNGQCIKMEKEIEEAYKSKNKEFLLSFFFASDMIAHEGNQS